MTHDCPPAPPPGTAPSPTGWNSEWVEAGAVPTPCNNKVVHSSLTTLIKQQTQQTFLTKLNKLITIMIVPDKEERSTNNDESTCVLQRCLHVLLHNKNDNVRLKMLR